MGAEEVFRRTGAILEGHFLLTSGLHSPVYWEKLRILQQPKLTQGLCQLITEHFQGKGIEVVAGPALGGVVLAYEVARQLGVRAIFVEREGGARTIRRGQSLATGEKVLVVDDVLTTGGSLRETAEAIRRAGGKVVGTAVLVDRSEGPVDLGCDFFHCFQTRAPSYRPDDCPLCRQGLPLQRLGGGSTPI